MIASNTVSTFQLISDNLDKLTYTGIGTKYHCPVCNGNDFSVDQDKEKYKCFNKGCASGDIREAILILSGGVVSNIGSRSQRGSHKKVDKNKIPASKVYLPYIPEQIDFLRLPSPVTDIPEYTNHIDKGYRSLTYWYSDTQGVERKEYLKGMDTDGNTITDKTFTQFHINENGQRINKQGDNPWPLYKINEVSDLLIGHDSVTVPLLLSEEGEQCVEIARSIGLAAICIKGSNYGSKNKPSEELIRLLRVLKEKHSKLILVHLCDNDDPGRDKGNTLLQACKQVGLGCIVVDLREILPKIKEKGDIEQLLEAMDNNSKELIDKLIRYIYDEIAKVRENQHIEDISDDSIPDTLEPDEAITQKVINFLFSDRRWICASDKLYEWTGTYYQHVKDAEIRPKITSYCNTYAVTNKNDDLEYPYANPATVKKVIEWVKLRFEVNDEKLNPPGINCINGIIQLIWDGKKVEPKLIDHTPDIYYTYEPLWAYDPEADDSDCDQLLSCLGGWGQIDIFLKTIGASFDLTTVRKYIGRRVKALLLKGDGNNGKDALREVTSIMYGRQGMTSITLSHFDQYDKGRQFPLAGLLGSRGNWPSENARIRGIDLLQSLKAAITGQSTYIERKGIDAFEFNPYAVFLFNINDTPDLQAYIEAIKSRFAVLSFDYTYVDNPDPTKGELKADPRFVYDPGFISSQVVPAFFNKCIEALNLLMSDGIDYKCTEQALKDIQAKNSHLYQFCQDTGLDYMPDNVLPIKQLWEMLEAWYISNGTLTYEENSKGKSKALWSDQVRSSDKNVKGLNQLTSRFKELFPKADIGTFTSGDYKNQRFIKGIGFSNLLNDSLTPLDSRDKVDIPDPAESESPSELNHPDLEDCQEVEKLPYLPYQVPQDVDTVSNTDNSTALPTALPGKATALPLTPDDLESESPPEELSEESANPAMQQLAKAVEAVGKATALPGKAIGKAVDEPETPTMTTTQTTGKAGKAVFEPFPDLLNQTDEATSAPSSPPKFSKDDKVRLISDIYNINGGPDIFDGGVVIKPSEDMPKHYTVRFMSVNNKAYSKNIRQDHLVLEDKIR